jgi:branched-chain amino acid transport system ATP-binding protein
VNTMLLVEGLRVSYGPIEAVKGVEFKVAAGEAVSLLGANGAGKTTTLLVISGLLRASAGKVVFDGQDITRWAPHRIVKAGLAQVAEGRAILTTLTVRENLELGAHVMGGHGPSDKLEEVLDLFPRLRERLEMPAGNLSGGEQQMLAIGRALMSHPRMLILDEPSMGLAPLMVQQIFAALREINQRGLTVLLVEQNVRQALRLVRRAYVLETGRIVLSGSAAQLTADQRLEAAYLGGDVADDAGSSLRLELLSH